MVESYTLVDIVIYCVGPIIQKAWDHSGFGDFLDFGSLAKKMGTHENSIIKNAH